MNQATETLSPISEADLEELGKLVNVVALSDRTLTLFAIAPESAPDHPVVKQLKDQLGGLDESFQFLTFFYSDNSLFDFLADLDKRSPSESGRRVILAFGLEQLPTPRMKKEMEQLNLGREAIFERNIVLIFWLNRSSFLNEFRSRASDFWDWRGKVAEFETRNPLLYPYLEWLIAENSYLKMGGVMQVNRQVDILLDRIYVSLQAEKRQQLTTVITKSQQEFRGKGVSRIESSSFDYRFDESVDIGDSLAPEIELEMKVEGTYTSEPIVEKVDLADVVRSQYACSVILGAPGAGKTTLLKYLALHFAKAKRDGIETVLGGADLEDLGKTRLPIYLKIANYAESLEDYPELSLLDYLIQFYRQWENYFDGQEASEVTELLLSQMQMGNCLILLDGLDEVFDQASRRLIVERINEFVDRFSHNKVIVTSRIAGYQEVKLSSRFTEFTITDLTIAQASQFLHRWCFAVEQAQKPEATLEQQEREGDRQAQLILGDIEKSDGVKRLTANPLLLTILALIHRNGERLPERRVKLYELAVQTLTADWQLSKKLPNAQKVLLPEGEVVELLAPMAYWMHEEKPSGLVTHEEVMQQLAPKLAELRGESPDAPVVQQAVEEFLRRVRETTGLFVERAPNTYGFMHLTFEEYFAARYIADNEISDILQLIQQHGREPRWEEPILLALGYYGSHSPKLINKLVEQLFRCLEAYQPKCSDTVKLRHAASADDLILWTKVDSPNEVQEFRLQDLLFGGQVVAQVGEVNANLRKKLIEKIVVTFIAIESDSDWKEKKQFLKLLRQIEQFNKQGEVMACLQTIVQENSLTKETRIKVRVIMLYVVSNEAESSLVECVNEIVRELEPDLFYAIKEFVEDMGEDMSLALESLLKQESTSQQEIKFITAMTYLRDKYYDKAVSLLQEISEPPSLHLSPYTAWSLAICYQEKEAYEQANDFYQECFEQLAACIEPNSLLIFWRNRGVCHRLHSKYEQAIDCFQQMLAIAKELEKTEEEALALYHFGRVYQVRSKYEEAITYYEQSRDIYQLLEKTKDIADLCYWVADCYCEWGKYEKALISEKRDLEIRKHLNDQPNIADAFRQLGNIYQAWGKYEEAITHYEQSRDIYQQLEKTKDIANQWYWIADSYCDWGKYEKALECQQRCLLTRQTLDDQTSIASAYYQLGIIYQEWGKYEEAIAHYEQSRDIYQQLEKLKYVASLQYRIADSYCDWGKYEKALECQQQCLLTRQTLDDQSSIAVTYYQLGRIYQEWGKYEEAITHYEQSRDIYQQLEKTKDIANQWYWIADSYCDWGKYEKALECQQRCLLTRQTLDDQSSIAFAYYQLGRIYQEWGKYEEAITHYEQSRDIYQQLEKLKYVASLQYRIADSYCDWGKYEKALECQQQCLLTRQTLDDQSSIAVTYYQLGRIYQEWGKYEEAITHYEQSRDIYQQLEKTKDIANQWYWIADSYCDWGKYEKALECQQRCLLTRQTLDDQSSIAFAYYQLGRIYQEWGKYEEAITYYEQSRDIYQQLEKTKDIANQWYWIADSYCDWGKYEKALECQQQCLLIHQTLDDQALIAFAYYQLGRIYQEWGKYEEAITHYEQSRDIYQQLEKLKYVASLQYRIADSYCDWGKYEKALECQQQYLLIHQTLDDQASIAFAYYQLGRIYQEWSKYEEAITYHEQSRDLYKILDLQKNVGNQLSWIASCYRDLKDYTKAIQYYQHSLEQHQAIEQNESVSKRLRQISNTQRQQAKYLPSTESITLLDLAEQNLQQALKIDTVGDYRKNLANDSISLALLTAERLRSLPERDSSIPNLIAQFKLAYIDGFTRFAELGQIVDSTEAALDIARAYLEIEPLADYDLAATLTHQSLQTFQDFNRPKLQASACKLLGEIYLKLASQQQPEAAKTAEKFLSDSLQLYRDLGIAQEIEEVEQLLFTVPKL